jgi:F-type H+-transporting ATPase subunit b
MQIVENMELISINATVIVQLVSFLLFMVVLNRVMVRPLRRMMAQRNVHIEEILSDISKADDTLKELNHQIQDQENRVRNSAFAIQHQIEDEGLQQAVDLVNQTRSEIDVMRKQAQKENDAKITQARQEVEAQAEPIANRIIDVLLGQRSLS